MGSILIPFDLLVLDKFFKDMISQCFLDQLTFFGKLDGFKQISRKRVDSMFLPRRLGHLKDVFFNRGGKLIALFNPLQTCCQHYSKCQVWIAGWVWGPIFHSRWF